MTCKHSENIQDPGYCGYCYIALVCPNCESNPCYCAEIEADIDENSIDVLRTSTLVRRG